MSSYFKLKALHQSLLLTSFFVLVGCGPKTGMDDAEQPVFQIDQLQLPTGNWALTSSAIQLSFCRDRTNEALMAEQDELNRWRLVGEQSAFPQNRREGLQQLVELYQAHDVLLYQLSGNFGAQWYRIAYRPNQPEPNVIEAFAKIGRDSRICFSSLDDGE
ncbi:MAG: hypothetical protein B7X54_04035 [Idiomarina sp. 34-48-12]|nr:MAG: hypothetical protein B7X54_04035 [Idiomarina sp. 34-48-12]